MYYNNGFTKISVNNGKEWKIETWNREVSKKDKTINKKGNITCTYSKETLELEKELMKEKEIERIDIIGYKENKFNFKISLENISLISLKSSGGENGDLPHYSIEFSYKEETYEFEHQEKSEDSDNSKSSESGLQRKKLLRSIKENYLEEFQKELNEILGINMEIEIDWDSFASVNELKFVPSVGIQRILNVMKEISKDPDGKEAIKEEIKKVSIKHISEDPEKNKKLNIENGIFTLEAGFGGSHTWVFNEPSIKEYLENNL